MPKTIPLSLIAAFAALGQDPKWPLPPLPIELPAFHWKEAWSLDAHRAKLETLHEEIAAKVSSEVSAKVSSKISEAMSRVRWPVAMAPEGIFRGRTTGHERSYERGLRALDSRRYEEALDAFSQAAAAAGPRQDAALLGKAYALHRLGRRDEALATVVELRKAHAASRWMADAQGLEAGAKQNAGDRAQMDAAEDLKILALSGLIHSDPEKAAPVAEQILKSSPSHKLKTRALQGLAGSDSERLRDLLVRSARGQAGNPDVQILAIRHLTRRRPENSALLREIYASATDAPVKRAVLQAMDSAEDKEEILRIVRSEKDPTLRIEAISRLGRQAPASAGETLVTMYGSESDTAVKKAIVDALYSQRNGKALVDLARKEKDPQARREIVSRLSRMNSKEGSDYLLEILK